MNETVCIVGLGYVGLPLACAFAKTDLNVIGFDISKEKIEELKTGYDRMNEMSKDDLKECNIHFTFDEKEIKNADYVIVAVPTPITKSKMPNLNPLKCAAETIGKNLKKGSVVILESTVYPGVTEDIVKPILENESGLKCCKDFGIGYSPERINPGDKEHTIDKIIKVVSGCDRETLEEVAKLYEKIIKVGVFKAKNIKTAEASKVIENIQRDLNIALMNELSLIFEKMNIDTSDVLAAANTKWNFGRYYPGLVGGHCIPVDPYYLVYKAKELGYHPQVILAGRSINDYMPKHVAELTIKGLNESGKVLRKSKVLIMGLTFKENVTDIRTSAASEIIKELKNYDICVIGYDPLIDKKTISNVFGIDAAENINFSDIDCLIIFSPHDIFKKDILIENIKKSLKKGSVIIDIKGVLNKDEAIRNGYIYRKI